jgi:hypothetical protein
VIAIRDVNWDDPIMGPDELREAIERAVVSHRHISGLHQAPKHGIAAAVIAIRDVNWDDPIMGPDELREAIERAVASIDDSGE